MEMSRVLAIDYTRTALSTTYSALQASHMSYEWNSNRNWDSGADATPKDNEAEIQKYWAQVRTEIPKDTPRPEFAENGYARFDNG